jgi:hypothetical protein
MSGLVWWVPYSGAAVQTLSVQVDDLEVTPERRGGGSVQTLDGRVHTSWLDSGDAVRLSVAPALELTSDSTARTVRDRLHLLIDHLQRGGEVGLAGDADQGWAGVTGSLALPGSSFSAVNSLRSIVAGTLSAGSRVVLVGSTSQAREEGRIATASAPAYTLSDSTLSPLSGTAVVRHRYTYPALQLAPGAQAVVESRRGVVYRLSLDLTESLARTRELLAVGIGGDLLVGLSRPTLGTEWRPAAPFRPFG